MMHFESLQGWLTWQEGLHPLAIDLGLERVARVYRQLNPAYQHPPTITVAGTNGKGSCVAYLETIYRLQGYRVGAYTSPHILKYNERIKINGIPVSDDLICAAFARIEAVRGETTLSYFEFSTLAALDIFRAQQIDVQILEVGLGGRLDAVNIVDCDVALISSIGIDHVDWLGKTREAIGREKAGIFRKDRPAIVGDPEPPDSLFQVAQEKAAKLYQLGKDFNYRKQDTEWSWAGADQHIEQLPEPALKGEHQYRNAAAVILAVKLLNSRLPVSEAIIKSGLANVKLPGRFQLVDGPVPVLLDVGHNPQAVQTLVDYLRDNFPDKRIHAIFSMMRDKDIAGVINIMKPVVHDWFFVPLTNPRAVSEAQIREIFLQAEVSEVSFGFSNFAEAFKAAQDQSYEGDLLLVFGSFFLVSDCLIEFQKN